MKRKPGFLLSFLVLFILLQGCLSGTNGDGTRESINYYQDPCAEGHLWVEATCLTPKTCSRCNLTEGKELGHS